MNSKKHTLSRKVLATLLTAAMLITMLPSAMFAESKDVQTTQDNEIYTLDISKSKHATNLQKIRIMNGNHRLHYRYQLIIINQQ